MKILTIVGARPQFIKAAPVSRELRKHFNEILVHTGQHYDKNMSDVFFNELNIPKPDYNLEVGSGSHGKQTGEMLIRIEEAILREKPEMLMVYGDTNSTIAGALAASKLHIPVIHVEAGLRSFNMKMPEEQNRILSDHISTLLFCPTETAVKNLNNEGIIKGVHNVGDVMYDTVLHNISIAERKFADYSCFEQLSKVMDFGCIKNCKIIPKQYYLATVHRAENTDDIKNLQVILESFEYMEIPVLMPIHPRTRKIINDGIQQRFKNIIFVEPVGYLEMLYLTKNARKVLTDSGGLQKEAYILNIPCVTLREQTEWIETLEGNNNVLAKIEINDILYNVGRKDINHNSRRNNYFGDGKAAGKIVNIINDFTFL